MFRKKAAQAGGETLMGRRAVLQLRDRLVKQYALKPQVGDLILGKRKKTDLRVTATKFERTKTERGIVYRMDFEDESNFLFSASASSKPAGTADDAFKGTDTEIGHDHPEKREDFEETTEPGSEGGMSTNLERSYCPNMSNLKGLPTTLPWMFELNMDKLFPTMHLLWIHSSLIPIPSLVILRNAKQFIFNGADLMAGGIIFEATKDITSIRKDQIWTIKCAGDNFPIAIGVSLVDWDDISDQSLRKGKVLRVVHHCNDTLSSEGNMSFEERMNTYQEKEASLDDSKPTTISDIIEDFEDVKLESKCLALEANQDFSKLDEGEPQMPDNELARQPDPSAPFVSEDSNSKKQSAELSQETYDLLLEALLLKVVSEYASNKTMLPTDTSAIWDKISRLCLQTYGIQVEIKKSSFIKVQKFFQFYSKKNVLSIKQGRGGVLNVVDVSGEEVIKLEKLNADNEVALKLPPIVRSKPKAPCSAGESKSNKTDTPQIEVVMLYQPDKNFSPILDYYNSKETTNHLGRSFPVKTSRGEKEQRFISISDAKTALEYYINSNDLKTRDANTSQKEKPPSIILDEVLENLFQKHLSGSSIHPNKKAIPISLAYKEIPHFLKEFHYIRNKSDSNSEEKPNIFKGPCKTIEIYTESRMGARKHITIISPSISHFNLDLHEVAESCQKKFASSATVSQIKKYPSSNNSGVIIQGNVASQLPDFLNSRWGIPKSFIKQC